MKKKDLMYDVSIFIIGIIIFAAVTFGFVFFIGILSNSLHENFLQGVREQEMIREQARLDVRRSYGTK